MLAARACRTTGAMHGRLAQSSASSRGRIMPRVTLGGRLTTASSIPTPATKSIPRKLLKWLTAGVLVGAPIVKVTRALLPLWSEEEARNLPSSGVETFTNHAPGSLDLEELKVSPWFLLSEASDRLIRDAATAAYMVAVYVAESRKPTPDWEAAHRRCAKRLLVLCAANRGVYIKLGQHVAMLEHLLPSEYVREMEPLCHTAPTSSFEDVRAVVEAELGQRLESVFDEFEPVPVASASLAQVHRARMRNTGQLVAVKVQHRGLREASSVDLRTIAFLADTIKSRFPKFEYGWLVSEVRTNLPKELDFRLEADNLREAGAQLQHRLDVTVPGVIAEASATRVLTMTFEEGCYITNRARIEAMGLSPTDVARSVAEVFNEQIFQHGFVHCDPHAGNILVRADPKRPGKPLLVLLDHGLYKRLDDEFRLQYARLWTSLIFAEEGGIKDASAFFGVGDQYPLFAAMLTTKPWDQIINPRLDSLRVDRSNQGKTETADYAKEYADEINRLLGIVPRDLLLLLKTLDCLRSIDAALGNPVDTFEITARACLNCILSSRAQRHPGWVSWYANLLDSAGLEARFAAFHAAGWWYGVTAADMAPAPSMSAVTMVGQSGGAEGGSGAT